MAQIRRFRAFCEDHGITMRAVAQEMKVIPSTLPGLLRRCDVRYLHAARRAAREILERRKGDPYYAADGRKLRRIRERELAGG